VLWSERVELYEVKKAGFRCPLSSREISHLFRAGELHRRVRCRPTGEESWSTIAELFPLLDHDISTCSLPADGARSGRRLAVTFAVMASLMAIGAFVYGGRPAGGSAKSRPITHSRHQEVAAATAANVFLPYSSPAGNSSAGRKVTKSRLQAAPVVLARNN
jgi:hypothetical protein